MSSPYDPTFNETLPWCKIHNKPLPCEECKVEQQKKQEFYDPEGCACYPRPDDCDLDCDNCDYTEEEDDWEEE